MNFLEMIIFTIVFMTVLFYFGIHFYNTSKINSYIAVSEIEDSLDYTKEIDKLCKVNILSYCLAYIILSVIYFSLTKQTGIFISMAAFVVFFILYSIYSDAVSAKAFKHKIRVYKAYNIVNFIFNLGVILASNISLVLVFV